MLARPAICVGLFVAFGGVLYGSVHYTRHNPTHYVNLFARYDTGTISGITAMNYWLNLFTADGTLPSSQNSLIVSILSAGTFFGALFAAPMADLLGRRIGLMLSCAVVFNLGVIFQTAATSQPLFIAGRFFAGLGVGLVSAMSK